MDFVIYADKTTSPSKFPAVVATPSAPKTLYHAPMDLVYVNTGSGWVAGVQPGSGSVYSGFSALPETTKANVLTSVANTTTKVPSATMTKAAVVAVRGR